MSKAEGWDRSLLDHFAKLCLYAYLPIQHAAFFNACVLPVPKNTILQRCATVWALGIKYSEQNGRGKGTMECSPHLFQSCTTPSISIY